MSIQQVPGSVLRTGDIDINTPVNVPEGPRADVCTYVCVCRQQMNIYLNQCDNQRVIRTVQKNNIR